MSVLSDLLTLAQTVDVQTTSQGSAVGGLLGGLVGCVFLIIGLAMLAFWVWMLIDAITRNFKDGTEKIIWILVIVFTGIIGAAIYYFVGRSRGAKGGAVV